jgi:hypothetical protein
MRGEYKEKIRESESRRTAATGRNTFTENEFRIRSMGVFAWGHPEQQNDSMHLLVKFTDGAWIPAVVIPTLVLSFNAVNRHYTRVRSYLQPTDGYVAPFRTHTVVVLVGSVNEGVLKAVRYAESLRPDRLLALSVIENSDDRQRLQDQWDKHGLSIELDTIVSEYRDLTEPILNRINELDDMDNDDLITVIIPEFVTSIRSQWLHNQSALTIKARLLFRPNTVVTSVPIVIP